jgi:hypothetical protein
MYRGFTLNDFVYVEEFYKKGLEVYERDKREINSVLENYITPEGAIDGTKLQENWFPKIDCDVFLSHSHKDEKIAITLSGIFKSVGIKSFVDSCVWGCSDDLLKIIDNRHCYNATSEAYDYNLRNLTTSHVHMMLANSLFNIIDNSECVFFLNTPNSIKVNDVITKTVSPWIYSEISITQIIRKKTPKRILTKSETRKFSTQKNINESINIEYDINLSHLPCLTAEDFIKWMKIIVDGSNENVLDILYRLFPLPLELSDNLLHH